MSLEDNFNQDDIDELTAAMDKAEKEFVKNWMNTKITNRDFFDWDVELEDLGW